MRNFDHQMSVEQVRTSIAWLRPDDLLIPTAMENLTIVRDGVEIGYIDFGDIDPGAHFWQEET